MRDSELESLKLALRRDLVSFAKIIVVDRKKMFKIVNLQKMHNQVNYVSNGRELRPVKGCHYPDFLHNSLVHHFVSLWAYRRGKKQSTDLQVYILFCKLS